jgi:hypothetical protein
MLSLTYILVLILLGIALFYDRFAVFMRKAAIICTIIFMVSITLLSFKIYQTEYIQSAIVLVKTVDARYEPLSGAPVHFRLYEGSKISVLKARGQWSQIKREDNKIGWILSDSYGIININQGAKQW